MDTLKKSMALMEECKALEARLIRISREKMAINMREDNPLYASQKGVPVVSHAALKGKVTAFEPCVLEDAMQIPETAPPEFSSFFGVELAPYLPALEAEQDSIVKKIEEIIEGVK